MPYIIGLTGGIGSGKTAVSDCFATKGIKVVDADVCARTIVEPGTPALSAITEHFGRGVLHPDGTLDRKALREVVFADPDERQWLEALLHPLIFNEMWQHLQATSSPYAILVSPLLVEAGQSAMCQRILVVDAPEEVQLARTMSRDSNSAEQVRAIMAAQASRTDRIARADDVIVNDGDLPALHGKVDALHTLYLSLAAAQQPF